MERYLNNEYSKTDVKVIENGNQNVNPQFKLDEFKKQIIFNIKNFDPLKKTSNYTEYTLKLMWIDFYTKNLVNSKKEESLLNLSDKDK